MFCLLTKTDQQKQSQFMQSIPLDGGFGKNSGYKQPMSGKFNITKENHHLILGKSM
jgi:hypothetical protein